MWCVTWLILLERESVCLASAHSTESPPTPDCFPFFWRRMEWDACGPKATPLICCRTYCMGPIYVYLYIYRERGGDACGPSVGTSDSATDADRRIAPDIASSSQQSWITRMDVPSSKIGASMQKLWKLEVETGFFYHMLRLYKAPLTNG